MRALFQYSSFLLIGAWDLPHLSFKISPGANHLGAVVGAMECLPIFVIRKPVPGYFSGFPLVLAGGWYFLGFGGRCHYWSLECTVTPFFSYS